MTQLIDIPMFNDGEYKGYTILNTKEIFEGIAKIKYIFFCCTAPNGEEYYSIAGEIVAIHPETNSVTVNIIDTLKYAKEITSPAIQIKGKADFYDDFTVSITNIHALILGNKDSTLS